MQAFQTRPNVNSEDDMVGALLTLLVWWCRLFRGPGFSQAFAGPSLGTGALLLGRPMGMQGRPRAARGTTCQYGIPLAPWARPGLSH